MGIVAFMNVINILLLLNLGFDFTSTRGAEISFELKKK